MKDDYDYMDQCFDSLQDELQRAMQLIESQSELIELQNEVIKSLREQLEQGLNYIEDLELGAEATARTNDDSISIPVDIDKLT